MYGCHPGKNTVNVDLLFKILQRVFSGMTAAKCVDPSDATASVILTTANILLVITQCVTGK